MFRILIACCILLLPLGVQAGDSIPVKKIETERLSDLNVARVSHATLFVNGELTVIGGHTDGFVPTATAEYFSDGAWHELPTVYSHDTLHCRPPCKAGLYGGTEYGRYTYYIYNRC